MGRFCTCLLTLFDNITQTAVLPVIMGPPLTCSCRDTCGSFLTTGRPQQQQKPEGNHRQRRFSRMKMTHQSTTGHAAQPSVQRCVASVQVRIHRLKVKAAVKQPEPANPVVQPGTRQVDTALTLNQILESLEAFGRDLRVPSSRTSRFHVSTTAVTRESLH